MIYELFIEKMKCMGCVTLVGDILTDLGVDEFRVELDERMVFIKAGDVKLEDIKKALKDAGYEAEELKSIEI
jgi:copper chaperone CopZ